jgi:adenosylmethionine-8-amino-7-oxononanoate aminotransferase
MKDFENEPPFIVHSAKGSVLHTNKGPVIDAISSWWCKSLGHGHPKVIEAIQKQMGLFEHVIGANTTHPILVELAEELADISGKQHVFFASDGSSAVEIALKLTLQAHQIKGNPHKNQFMTLENSYHGETLGALSLTDLGLYNAPFKSFGYPSHTLSNIPYVSGPKDPLWSDCTSYWENILAQLEQNKEELCAVIVEPLVQGAGGMLCYSADFLGKLANWAKDNDVYFIADEIMTGMGRTGEWLACQHAPIDPSLICLSKGLTSGTLPFSCVLIDHDLFDLFYEEGEAFWHSHTFSGHALGAAAALATIGVIRGEQMLDRAKAQGLLLHELMHDMAQSTGALTKLRGLGALMAAQLSSEHHPQRVAKKALDLGALLRPIGNTLYWLAPLNTDEDTIRKLAQITLHSLDP